MNFSIDTDTRTQIIDLHNGIAASLRRSVGDAIEAGRLLSIEKERVGHGNWLPYVEGLPFTVMTATRYMGLNEHQSKLNNVLNLSDAYKTVAQIEDNRPRGKSAPTPAQTKSKLKAQERMAEHIEEDRKLKGNPQAYVADEVDQLIDEAKQSIRTAEEVSTWALDGEVENLAQTDIFMALDRYVYSFAGVSRQLEAVQNLIKKMRGMAVRLHGESS